MFKLILDIEILGKEFSIKPSESCSGRCNYVLFEEICHCDKLCREFGDCCIDFDMTCPSLATSISQGTGIARSMYTCNSVYNSETEDVVYMVNTCPSSWNQTFIRSRCMNNPINMHVYDKHGINYRNVYCALCNGLKRTDIKFWDIDDISTSECRNNVVVRGSQLRKCIERDEFLGANHTNGETSTNEACSTYVFPRMICNSIFDKSDKTSIKETFINPFCAFGSGYNLSYLKDKCYQGRYPIAIKDIWNFRSAGKPSGEVTCPLGQIFDEVSQACRQIMCDTGYSLQGEKCILKNKSESIVDTWKCAVKVDYIIFRGHFSSISCFVKYLWEDYKFRGGVKVFKHHASPDRDDVWVAFEDGISNTSKNLAGIKKLIQNETLCRLGFIEVLSFCSKPYEACESPMEWIAGSPVDFQYVENIANYTDVYRKGSLYFSASMVMYVFNYDGDTSEILLFCARVIYVPVLHCTERIGLNRTEYSWNKSGLFYESRKFDNGEFIISSNGIAEVCKRAIQTKTKNIKTSSFITGALDAANLVLTCFSVLGLVGTMITYVKFKSLLNLYGQGIVCLSLALLLANVFTIFSNKLELSELACVILGAWTHYLWLVVFSWTAILAIILTSTFTGNVTQWKSNSTKTYILYVTLGWGAPLLLVSLLLSLHMCKICFSSDIAVYGGSTTCWLVNSTINLYAFGVPVATCLILNFVLVTITLISLWKKRQASKKLREALKNEDKWTEVVMFLKVSWQR